MFDRLLIATDGSDCARRAAKYGIELAARYDADVDVVSVYRGGETQGQATLDEIADLAADAGVAVDTELLSGKPAKSIVDYADETGADLIVVGRRGRSGVRERLLGSITERVLRRSGPPVLTVSGSEVDADTGTAYDDILVTTDGSDLAAEAGPYAANLAGRFDAILHVLNAVDVQAAAGVFNAGGVDREYIERLERKGQRAVDDLIAGIDATDLDVREAVVQGYAPDVIADYVDENDVDLVVMSSEGQSNLAGQQLGTVAGRVLRTVDRPVLVVTED
ncbi:universal stress protein [Haloplanus rubicundus]|uniref:Universal stress protein n=1 Tax=Haloplanus rubicundus TaxID=1547898 RepID=A0A345E3A2_9EURY|nr:universal stress protein [Haloplanus rubicundus]AXG06674.1 universal stress protein [Haloplanus rubicundus]